MARLNKEQKEAVEHYQGPLLIIAGPGTGKTTVLTHRLAYLIQKRKVKPDQILAVTFTNKAAKEMEERVDNLLPFSCFDLRVGTFHSLGEEILREHGLEIGLPLNFKVLDQRESWLMMRQYWSRFDLPFFQPLGDPGSLISALLTHFSRCKDEGISPERYEAFWQREKKKGKNREEVKKMRDLVKAYKTYQALLIENKALDFGDLINDNLLLFQKRPRILKAYQARWPFILIDEFQDTNWSQYQLVKFLAKPKNNLTICTSGDQAIYQWRGASFTNVFQFTKDYPKAKLVVLKRNYRSRQAILDLSYRFIQANNPHRLEFQIKKKKNWSVEDHLVATKKGKASIQILHFAREGEEVNGVIKKIRELLQEVPPQEIAILSRTHQSLRPFEKALQHAGIDYQSSTAESLYHQPIIVDLLAYFQVLDNHFNDPALYKVLNLPFWRIKTETISRLIAYRQKKGTSLFQGLDEAEVSPLEEQKLQSFRRSIEKYAQMLREKSLSEVFVRILDETGWLKWLVAQKDEKNIAWLNQFYERLRRFEENSFPYNLHDFLRQVEMIRDEGGFEEQNMDIQKGPEAVKVMTVHASKGLEFEYVFLVNLINQRFPSNRRRDLLPLPEGLIRGKIPRGDLHLEEERRLFYVAMTRAKKGLFFTWADDYGGSQKRRPSRFLQELGLAASLSEQRFSPSVQRKPKKKKAINKNLLPNHFSYTQFAAFQTCPQQYKFAHILKLPARGRPERSFGKTMHRTLELFLKTYVLNPKFSASWEALQKLYRENWIDDWYENEKQRKEYFQRGKRQLKLFWKNFQKERPKIYLRQGEPFLEKEFLLPLGPYSLKGKIDRLDTLEDGVEIIDYKTGKPPKRLNAEKKQQLLLYQIAAEEVFGLHPKKLSFYYLEDGSKLSFFGTDKEKQATKEKILEIIKEIQKSSFPAKPSYLCRYCDYRHICEYY